MAAVLLVEDDRDVATTFSSALASDGHNVHTAYDGWLALLDAASEAPAIALIDMALPIVSGIDVAYGLRHMYGNEVGLIGCTAGYADDKVQPIVARAPFHSVFTKPVPIATLLECVRALDVARGRASNAAAVRDEDNALERARRHVADGERRLDEQRARIARLAARGYDTRDARMLLATMAQAQLAMRGHLALIERGGKARNGVAETVAWRLNDHCAGLATS